jgi:serine/threonine-protein kinase
VEAVSSEPIELTPEDRYYCGHYLAYLLGGSRRQGFLLRRPLDPLNADRARLLLAMAALGLPEERAVPLAQAAQLLDDKPDCRAWLSPVAVMKYLASRSTPAKRRAFRAIRQKLQQVSSHARDQMTDERGLLNPGLMPQTLEDLKRMAPARSEVDDELVERWNVVSRVWRENAEFRNAVLGYATSDAAREPASIDLWPEVVYPLIERARRQRKFRSKYEAVWDALCGRLLHVGDAGVRLDRVLVRAVPRPVILSLDDKASQFTDELKLQFEEPPPAEVEDVSGVSRTLEINPASFADIRVHDEPDTYLQQLARIEPVRLTLGELRELWKEAVATLQKGDRRQSGHQPVAIGPYRLAVVATIRVRSAGQVAIQGMPNKQVELLVPSFASRASHDRYVLAAWPYQNNSLLITHVDHLSNPKYVIWDAVAGKQLDAKDRGELERLLFQLTLELPEDLDTVLKPD